MVTTRVPQSSCSLSRWPGLLKVLLFLVLTRAILNLPAMIGAHWFSGSFWGPFVKIVGPLVCGAPNHFPCIWARWDAEDYLVIAVNGYSLRENVVFFPAYPLLIRLFAFGFPSLMAWSGVFISNVTFIVASLVLWWQIKRDFNQQIAWGTIVTLSLFPTAFFFSAIYAESLLLLCSVLVYVFSSRKQYLLAGLFVGFASVTRPTGLLLIVIPLAEILLHRPSRAWLRFLGTASISGIGLGVYGCYLWIVHGSPLAFALVEQQVWLRSIDWPWRIVSTVLKRIISGFRHGHHWYEFIFASELLSILLFTVLTILGFLYLKKSLAIYLLASALAFFPQHAHHMYLSMSRFVLEFFPGFIVLAILLSRYPRLEQAIWAISAVVLLLLTGFFASGLWIAEGPPVTWLSHELLRCALIDVRK